MSKRIKSTYTDIQIDETTIEVIKINGVSFEWDSRFPWINVYFDGDNSKDFLEEIDEPDVDGLITDEAFRRIALNWYFNNVEIVADSEIHKGIPEEE